MTGRMARVLELLRTRDEICSLAALYGDALANGRNDISTLSRRGWIIDSWWVSHTGANHKHYRLLRGDALYWPLPERPTGKCAMCVQGLGLHVCWPQ